MSKHIVSFSGGKDSTAMLHLILEKGMPVDEVVFFDTGWEFPQMLQHISKVENKTGIKITRLLPEEPFEHYMFKREVRSRFDRPEQGIKKGEVFRIGYGWPAPMRRWCTRLKVEAINKYLKKYDDVVSYVGFAFDELQRLGASSSKKQSIVYPLIDYKITEQEALNYCYSLGYRWDGLYEIFDRVSCFCCPLQRIGELRKLRKYFPKLWQKMLHWDSICPEHNKGFRNYDKVIDLEDRFQREEKQLEFIFMQAI